MSQFALAIWADQRYGFTIDTLHVARKVFAGNRPKPTNMKLGTLYQFLTGRDMQFSHRASADVNALYTIFCSESYWDARKGQVQASIIEGTNVVLGKEILAKSGLKIISADDLADAAQKIVAAVNDESNH